MSVKCSVLNTPPALVERSYTRITVMTYFCSTPEKKAVLRTSAWSMYE